MYREQYGEYANWYKGVKDEFCTQLKGSEQERPLDFSAIFESLQK